MRFLRRATVVAITLCACALPLAAQMGSTSLADGVSRRGRLTVSGTLHEADSGRPLDNVEVKLSAFSAGAAASAFTNASGDFSFNDVRSGTYYLVVELNGYQRIQEEVNLAGGSSMGIQLSLKRAVPGYERVGKGPTVSARDLAIPRAAREAMERGLSLMRDKSDLKGGISQFERAVRAYPQYYEAYAQMGVAYSKMGDPAKAEQSLQTSIDLSKHGYPEALVILASLYSVQKRFSDAEPLSREALQLNAKSVEANQELARALYGLDRNEEAEPFAIEAERLDPKSSQTQLLLANIHLKLRNGPELIKNLDTYLQLAPNGPQADQVRRMRQQIAERLAEAAPEPTAP